MITRIKILNGTEESNALWFTDMKITERVNILIGGNGVGKSTLLSGIRNGTVDLEFTKPIAIHSYQNSLQSDRNNHANPYSGKEILRSLTSRFISEGQGIVRSISREIDRISVVVKEQPDVNHILLWDEVDSGLSIENINLVGNLIAEVMIEHNNIQLFVASNMYQWIAYSGVGVNMYTGKTERIKSYDEYAELIIRKAVELNEKNDYVALSEPTFKNKLKEN